MSTDSFERIRNLVSRGEVSEALQELLRQPLPMTVQNEARLHSARLARLENEVRKHIIPRDEASASRSEIVDAVLALLDIAQREPTGIQRSAPPTTTDGGISPPKASGPYEYDVALSFAGEERDYVRDVAECLHRAGVRVFFDDFEKTKLWGRDLYDRLDDVYRNKTRYCVVFISRAYAEKVWTRHERRSIHGRSLLAGDEYLLPVRFDDTELPGLPPTIAYLDLRTTGQEELVARILEKVTTAGSST